MTLGVVVTAEGPSSPSILSPPTFFFFYKRNNGIKFPTEESKAIRKLLSLLYPQDIDYSITRNTGGKKDLVIFRSRDGYKNDPWVSKGNSTKAIRRRFRISRSFISGNKKNRGQRSRDRTGSIKFFWRRQSCCAAARTTIRERRRALAAMRDIRIVWWPPDISYVRTHTAHSIIFFVRRKRKKAP